MPSADPRRVTIPGFSMKLIVVFTRAYVFQSFILKTLLITLKNVYIHSIYCVIGWTFLQGTLLIKSLNRTKAIGISPPMQWIISYTSISQTRALYDDVDWKENPHSKVFGIPIMAPLPICTCPCPRPWPCSHSVHTCTADPSTQGVPRSSDYPCRGKEEQEDSSSLHHQGPSSRHCRHSLPLAPEGPCSLHQCCPQLVELPHVYTTVLPWSWATMVPSWARTSTCHPASNLLP